MSVCVGHVIVILTAFRLACWIQGVKPVKDHHISLIFATTKEFLVLNFLHHLKGPSGQNYIGFGLVIFRCTCFKFLNFISNFYSYFEVLSRFIQKCTECAQAGSFSDKPVSTKLQETYIFYDWKRVWGEPKGFGLRRRLEHTLGRIFSSYKPAGRTILYKQSYSPRIRG